MYFVDIEYKDVIETSTEKVIAEEKSEESAFRIVLLSFKAGMKFAEANKLFQFVLENNLYSKEIKSISFRIEQDGHALILSKRSYKGEGDW